LIELPCRQGQLKDSFARIEGDRLFVLVDYRNLLKITPQFAQIANNFFSQKSETFEHRIQIKNMLIAYEKKRKATDSISSVMDKKVKQDKDPALENKFVRFVFRAPTNKLISIKHIGTALKSKLQIQRTNLLKEGKIDFDKQLTLNDLPKIPRLNWQKAFAETETNVYLFTEY